MAFWVQQNEIPKSNIRSKTGTPAVIMAIQLFKSFNMVTSLTLLYFISGHHPTLGGEMSVGSRRWNWKFQEKHGESRIPNFCCIQGIVFDLSYLSVTTIGSDWDLASPLTWKICEKYKKRFSGFGFQKYFSRNFQFYRRDPIQDKDLDAFRWSDTDRYFFRQLRMNLHTTDNLGSVGSPHGTGTYLDNISASYFCMNWSIFIICWVDSISTFVSANVMISNKWSSFWFFCWTGIHGLPGTENNRSESVRMFRSGPRFSFFVSWSRPFSILGSLTVAQTGATRVSNWTPLIYY